MLRESTASVRFRPGSAIVVAFGPTCTPTYTVDDLGGLFSAASHLVVFVLLVLALLWTYCHVRKVEKSFSTYTTVKELHAVHGEKIKHDGPDSDSDEQTPASEGTAKSRFGGHTGTGLFHTERTITIIDPECYDTKTSRGSTLGWCYAFITGALSGYNLVFTKNVSETVKTSAGGDNQFGNASFYLFAAGLILCNGFQIKFLNASMEKFDALFIVPLYQVMQVFPVSIRLFWTMLHFCVVDTGHADSNIDACSCSLSAPP